MVQTNEPEARAPPQLGDLLRITVAANQGGRRYMEDRCVVHTERDDAGELQWTYVGVYDGHGGEHASEYVRRNLLTNIMKNRKFASEDDEDILESIRQGFLMTHEQMRDVYENWPFTASGFPSTAGTTVSCVFIRNGKLYTGHVGDSAIYLGTVENGRCRSRPLTVDHKPESAHEQIRIARAGGETAVKSGVTRVVWKRPAKTNMFTPRGSTRPIILDSIPFLSVARSLGDLWSYNKETNMFVVSPEPDLAVHRLTGNDFCLVLASDGMTNVLTGEQAVEIVFKEEELVEMHDEMVRNHSRCVLRTTLQKWRSLRADNVTVATVIFDIDPLSYTEGEVLMKVDNDVDASQVLTDYPDAMLNVSKTENVLLTTGRTPIIYNGSRDVNYCRVHYRGPGFRAHEEELAEERRHIMTKFKEGTIAIANGTTDSKRGPRLPISISPSGRFEYEDDEYDEDDEDDEEDDGPFDPSEEISLTVRVAETAVALVRSAVFIDDSIVNELDSNEGVQSTSSMANPVHTPNGVTRVKAEAIRRLRTPRIDGSGDSTTSTERSGLSPEKRVTRSASRANSSMPSAGLPKTPSPTRIVSVIGINMNLTPDAHLPATPRRSNRLNNGGGIVLPVTPMSTKLTMSRKRARTAEMAMTTGVTPVVAGLSLQDNFHLQHHQPVANPTRLMNLQRSVPVFPPATPSRSAPSSPKRGQFKTSKWSLSQLDEKRKETIERVSEVADEEDDMVVVEKPGDDDVMREPPSKMRRFYGYMKKMLWGK